MNLIDPGRFNNTWVLSGRNETNPIAIPQSAVKNFERQDILVVDFLYRSYAKQLNGVILNEEESFNPHLQVSTFLGALDTDPKTKFLVLILCPDDLIVKWHYYMSQSSKFELKVINPSTVPEDFDHDGGVILFLSFTNIQLAKYLKEYDFSSVVIDSFDEVATKLAIQKLQGHFNVGITSRNFYVNPDQKLQWNMLNWANPGCVGKLAEFYEIDNDNFANFRDNYKEWWFRLTWNFCESFVKPTLEDKGHLISTLRDWGKAHNLTVNHQIKNERKRNARKRKVKSDSEVEESIESKDIKQNKRPKKVYQKTNKTKKDLRKIVYKTNGNTKKKDVSSDSSDSSDTIVYENDTNLADDVDTADSDEPPIGGSSKIKVQNKEIETETERKSADIVDHSTDDDSVSSGEQLLCSLVGTKKKKSHKNNKILTQTELQNCDESDLFLRSVAASSSDLSPLKSRKKAEEFFDKIFVDPNDKQVFNSRTQMEMELEEQEVLDVPSESDSFFKGIFNKDKNTNNNLSDRGNVKETDNCNEGGNFSGSKRYMDIDTLVAEVMEMVVKK